MITNERQYRITMKEIRNFEHAIEELSAGASNETATDALGREILLDAMRSQLADLRADIPEGEAVLPGRGPSD